MNSLKLKVALIASVVSILALIILGTVAFIFSKDALLEAQVRAQSNFLKATEVSIGLFREKNLETLQILEKEILSKPYSSLSNQEALMENVGDLLVTFRKAHQLIAVFIGQSSGENIIADELEAADKVGINGKANNYDATTREWYQEARKSNDIYTSSTYVDFVTKKTVITYSKALYKEGKFIGVLAMDVSLDNLQKEIERTPGNTYLIDRDDKVFVSTNKELLKTPDIAKEVLTA